MGCIWNAEYAGGRVVRYAPDGRVLQEIKLPVTQVTCAGFGGKNLGTLYITTAAQNLSDEQKAAQPLAGALFAIDVGVRGIPESRFLG
jgi:sugar lactone lactonase YvrE